MRWESQNVDSDNAGRLPGLGADAVVRRFDAPEALDMRFHEVRTKSALNRVPGAARLPFEWTVNPYRGCTHACVYCLCGETPILLASGRTTALADLRVGEEIYGTAREGAYRRYVRTEVLAHWSTVKAAYRIALEDGTELVASADHRFLTAEGFKHVVDPECGLIPGDRVVGTGGFVDAPVVDADYRRGYLGGLLRDGDPALAEAGVRERADRYADELGLASTEPVLAGAARPWTRPPWRPSVAAAWPRQPSASWRKGFLAGVFDAAGSCRDALRLGAVDDATLGQMRESLRALGFRHVVEDRPDHWRDVRVLGGTPERMRFLLSVDPSATVRRSIEGRSAWTSAGLKVASVEPVGVELPMYDITTGTGDFIANGVVSHNCFARPTHEYLDMDAGRDFEREIVVKVNVPEVLRVELARPAWKGERVALGTNTDPYQWVEGRYKLMRGVWEALRDFRNPCSILTKSPLVLRDLDLLKEIATVTDVTACLSVPTLDEKAWRATEPHTPNPKARLEAVGELNRNGIPTGILVAPLMPGINDAPEQVERIVEAAVEANATYVGGNTLFLRGSVRRIFFDWLRRHRPDLVPRYERLYAKGAYLSPAERREIEEAAGAPWVLKDYPADRFRHRHRGGFRRPAAAAPPPPPKTVIQESLF